MKKRVVMSLALVSAMALSLVGCGGSSSTASQTSKASEAATSTGSAAEESAAASTGTESSGIAEASTDGYTVLVMPKLTNIPYFQIAGEGAMEAGKELGVNVIYDGPTTADAAQQVTMLENYIARALMLSVSDRMIRKL